MKIRPSEIDATVQASAILRCRQEVAAHRRDSYAFLWLKSAADALDEQIADALVDVDETDLRAAFAAVRRVS